MLKLLKKLRNRAKEILTHILHVAMIMVAVMCLAVIAANGPTLHKAWLRSKVGNNVYRVLYADETGRVRGGGTGFAVVAPSGVSYILTNAHVCEIFKGTINVELHDGRLLPRQILEISKTTDLCLVEGVPGQEGLELASRVDVGQTLALIGHPVLQPLSIMVGDIVGKSLVEFPYAEIADKDTPEEIIEARHMMTEAQCISQPKFKAKTIEFWGMPIRVCMLSLVAYETTITAHGGNSGSPVVNFWGNVSGVLYAGSSQTNWGLVITLDDVKAFLAPY